MKLRYILGVPGSGKTNRCLDEIHNAIIEGKRCIYIAPEQFTLETERLLCQKFQGESVIFSEVTSFLHLANRIMLKYGHTDKKMLDPISNILLLKRIVMELCEKDAFVFYRRVANTHGFVEKVAGFLKECLSYYVTPEMLTENIDTIEDQGLSGKLRDIGLIYAAYMEAINREYISKENMLDTLAEYTLKYSLFENTYIWIDSFGDFTPPEIKVIGALMEKCPQITISFTTDVPFDKLKNSVNTSFYEAKSCISRINRMAVELSMPMDEPVFLDKDLRHRDSPMLEHLTYHYFSGFKYKNKPADNEIQLFSATTAESEVVKTAWEILTLTTKGYSYGDICVMISNEGYYGHIKDIFNSYGINYFADQRRGITNHPFTRLILRLLRLAVYGYTTENVMELIKTDFTPVKGNNLCLFENYCRSCNIRGRAWFEEWDYIPEKIYSEDKMDIVNDMRMYVADILDMVDSLKEMKNETMAHITDRLYDIFYEINVPDSITALVENAVLREDNEQADTHRQIWDIIRDIFEKLCHIMGDKVLGLEGCYKLLDTIFKSASLGLIPPTCDGVTVATFNRSKLSSFKVLFMLGVNEGVVPPHYDDTNLFSDSDRIELAKRNCELGGDIMRLINKDSYNIYTYVTKPSQRLYLSYTKSGGNTVASKLIYDLKRMFNLPVGDVTDLEKYAPVISSKEQAYELLLKHLSKSYVSGGINNEYENLYKYLKSTEDYKERLCDLERAAYYFNELDGDIDKETAEKLFLTDDGVFKTGITGVEAYSACPYAYLMDKGIRAKDPVEYEPSSLDYGTFLHNVLKRFSERTGSNRDWQELYYNEELGELNDKAKAMLERIVDETGESFKNNIFQSSNEYRYISKQLKDVAKTTVKGIIESAVENGFKPCGYELNFGYGGDDSLPSVKYELENGKTLELRGSIDRVDVYERDGKTYVKVVDYKTGKSKYSDLSLEKIILGLQIQLPFYLQTMTDENVMPLGKNYISRAINKPEKEIELHPAGFLYFRLGNPVRDEGEALEKKLYKGGIALNDSVISSLFYKGKNKVTQVSEKSFERLNKHITKIVKDMATAVTEGRISQRPYTTSDDDMPCSYCDYSAICGREMCNKNLPEYRRSDDKIINDIFKEDE